MGFKLDADDFRLCAFSSGSIRFSVWLGNRTAAILTTTEREANHMLTGTSHTTCLAGPSGGPADMDLKPTTEPIKSFFYVVGGWLCLGLAVVGAVLPLLPTTPFLLLASYCFYKGSPRLHAWLHRSKSFGPTLDDWHHYRGIRKTLKYRAVVMVAAVVTVSFVLSSLPDWLRLALVVLVSIGLVVIWRIPTLPDDAPKAPRMSAG